MARRDKLRKISTSASILEVFEDRVELFEFRATVNWYLTGTVLWYLKI